MSGPPPKVEVVVLLSSSSFGACLFRSPRLYFPYGRDQENHLEGEKASTSVSESARYYVQQREMQAFLVRELAAPSHEPGEQDRIVRLFPDRESACHFAEVANGIQRKLVTHTATSWSVRAV